jgi:hypothetical protein
MTIHRSNLLGPAMLTVAVMCVLMTGCSAGDEPGTNGGAAGGGGVTTAPGPGQPGSATDPDQDTGGTAALVWNECPIDASGAPKVVQAIEEITGYEVIEELSCRFTDGVRLADIMVVGNNDHVLDAKQPFTQRGYHITDLDRGQNGFLAVGELDAHARANFGDLALVLNMSSFEADSAGYAMLARAIMDIAVGR